MLLLYGIAWYFCLVLSYVRTGIVPCCSGELVLFADRWSGIFSLKYGIPEVNYLSLNYVFILSSHSILYRHSSIAPLISISILQRVLLAPWPLVVFLCCRSSCVVYWIYSPTLLFTNFPCPPPVCTTLPLPFLW